MRTIEEVLNCVNYCMFSKGCTKENYDCCYGDKGLSDCDVRLENDYKKIIAEVKKINTFDRLEEICNAERGRKLVVLPCRVGDTVYVLTTDSPTGIEETKVYQINSRFTNNRVFHKILCKCVYDDWGNARWEFAEKDFDKTVFLTREEAEKALKGGAK